MFQTSFLNSIQYLSLDFCKKRKKKTSEMKDVILYEDV